MFGGCVEKTEPAQEVAVQRLCHRQFRPERGGFGRGGERLLEFVRRTQFVSLVDLVRRARKVALLEKATEVTGEVEVGRAGADDHAEKKSRQPG